MATSDFLLEIKGPDVKGESQDKQFPESIAVDNWHWSGSNVGTHYIGSGGGSGKATHADFSFSKVYDKTSAALFDKLNKGDHFNECILHCRKTAGDTPIEYLKVTMKKVTVSSLSFGGSGGGNQVAEQFGLAYEEIKFEYVTQNADGTKGKTVQAGWNLAQNKAAA